MNKKERFCNVDTIVELRHIITNQIGCSFHWMPELVKVLKYYTKHRKRYKTLGDYYPEITKCLDKYVKGET